MENRYLFRGKRMDTGEWAVGGSIIQFLDDGKRSIYIPQFSEKCTTCEDEHENLLSFESGVFYKVDPTTVGQCTGLTAAKSYRGESEEDRLVFEGDIVYFTVFDYSDADTQYKGIVKFSGGQWELWKDANFEYYGSDGAFPLYLVFEQDDELEIIGNIHEHPHLLEKEAST